MYLCTFTFRSVVSNDIEVDGDTIVHSSPAGLYIPAFNIPGHTSSSITGTEYTEDIRYTLIKLCPNIDSYICHAKHMIAYYIDETVKTVL